MIGRVGKVFKVRRRSLGTSSNLRHDGASSKDRNQPDRSSTEKMLSSNFSSLRISEENTIIPNPHITDTDSPLQLSSTPVSTKNFGVKNGSKTQRSVETKRPTFCFLEPVKDGKRKLFLLAEEDVCLDPSGIHGDQCILDSSNIQAEDSVFLEANQSLSTSTLLSPLNLKLGGLNPNTSASSLDSGVGSARNSKRPSIEQLSPDPAPSVSFTLGSLGGRRSGCSLQVEGGLPSHDKENKPKIRQNGVPVIVEDKPTKRRSRLSVDEEAFSQLLRAATEVVSGAQPDLSSSTSLLETLRNQRYLKNSLRDFQRRKSQWDHPLLQPEHEKSRKTSAGPILQRAPSIKGQTLGVEGGKQRSLSSSCIICERKRKVSQVCDGSNVLIKTSMANMVQVGRRFSEVLKVYKPGELPFTEFVVPKIRDLIPPSTLSHQLVSAEDIRILVDEHMPTFVRLTSWSCLYAHLVSKKLLDSHMREYMIGTTTTQHEKGNKFYGEYLPSHGELGYQRLLECLKEEQDHTGHETLVKILEDGLNGL